MSDDSKPWSSALAGTVPKRTLELLRGEQRFDGAGQEVHWVGRMKDPGLPSSAEWRSDSLHGHRPPHGAAPPRREEWQATFGQMDVARHIREPGGPGSRTARVRPSTWGRAPARGPEISRSPKLIDLRDGPAVYDERQEHKLPDCTYAKEPAGRRRER